MTHSTESDNCSIAAKSLPDDSSEKNRKRFFKGFRKRQRRWSMTMTARLTQSKECKHEKRRNSLSTVGDSIGSDSVQCTSYDPFDPLSATYETLPDNSLHSCLRLLTSDDLDLNRVGLQRLNRLTSGRTIQDFYRSEEIASFVLVFGGPEGSTEERLRSAFVKMICDDSSGDNDHTGNTQTQALSNEGKAIEEWALAYDPSRGDSEIQETGLYADERSDEFSLDSSCYNDCKTSWTRRSQGKAKGILHTHALKILANALGYVHSADPTALAQINLQSSLWKKIIMSLVENIEKNHTVNATYYSMKILRFLHFIKPETILPLLKYSLFLDLVGLEEYGEEHGFPMITKEASKLLKHALSSK